jgi:60 kDa SS-A/Ro ribonucleoprotein
VHEACRLHLIYIRWGDWYRFQYVYLSAFCFFLKEPKMSVKTLASYIARRRERQVHLVGTPQTVKARKEQVFNSAGGAVFAISKWDHLLRFLILGSEGGSYYAGEQKLTVENAKNVIACIKEDGLATVDMIVDVSKSGRAPKNDPALLALALCTNPEYADAETRGYALAMLPEVARIGTHLFHFAEFVNSQRGWGRLLREGIANWYTRQDEVRLANQVIKYQQRDGWSHRDLLRLSHPKPDSVVKGNLYRYIVKGAEGMKEGDVIPELVVAFERAKTADRKTLIKLIQDYNLTREMLPTETLNDADVWEALLENMPMTAMIRNLGKMTSIGLLTEGSNATVKVVNTVTDGAILKKARVHPFTILVALGQYSQGRGLKGSLTWNAVPQIKNALDEGFYASFGLIESTGKRTLLSLDISGSMHGGNLCNSAITCAQGALAMAMVTMRTEPAGSWKLMGFGSPQYQELKMVTSKMKLNVAVDAISRLGFGATDCSLPMIYALNNKIPVDTFAVYTDNETWAGRVQPFEALRQYRDKMGIESRLVVVGMTATKFSIADPKDKGMMDVVGFDTATPDVIAGFSSGNF